MSASIRISILAGVAALAAVTTASPALAQRQPPPKPACGIVSFPFIEGIEYVYVPIDPPTKPTGPVAKPKQPPTVTVKVASVKTEGQGPTQTTTITLEEKAGDRAYTTQLSCAKDALTVPPESFYFSGEPGGGMMISLGAIERTGSSYMFKGGLLRVPEWTENIKAPFTRTASEGSGVQLTNGTLDMQRNVLVGFGSPEVLTTGFGAFNTWPMMVDLRGSVVLDFKPESKSFNIPANTISKIWLAERVGIVQVYNTNGHMYQLAEIRNATADMLKAKVTPPPAPAAPAAPAAP